MVVTASPETYNHIIEYGLRKVTLRLDRLILQAFMAGVYIGIAGNACIGLAGGIPTLSANPEESVYGSMPKSLQRLIYAMIFPTAFIAIIFTGAELFTGNTMTMLICWFEKRITIIHLMINWFGSFIGNWLGTLFSAYFLTYLCCSYDQEPYLSYLSYTAVSKVSYGWGSCFLRGIGCNVLVCLAVWNVTACDDAAGKILALWFPIISFVCAGYEHVIANLYTLQLCAMIGTPVPLWRLLVDNIIPTLLGNIIGGCVLIATVYWYNFYPLISFGRESILGDAEAISQDPLANSPSKVAVSIASLSRAHSRVSISPSVLGLGPKPVETFGGTSNTIWPTFGNANASVADNFGQGMGLMDDDPMFPRRSVMNARENQETATGSPVDVDV